MAPSDDWEGLGTRNNGLLIALTGLATAIALGPTATRIAVGIATGNPQQLEQTLGVAQTAETKPEFFVFARPDRPVIALVANAGPDSGVPYFCDFASGRKLRTGSIRPEDVKAPITARACIRINGVDYRSPETVVFARDRADPSALLITVNGETMRVRNSPSRSAENESKGFDR